MRQIKYTMDISLNIAKYITGIIVNGIAMRKAIHKLNIFRSLPYFWIRKWFEQQIGELSFQAYFLRNNLLKLGMHLFSH